MVYFIFLKSLRILEEFRKNPHIRIPSKSPCANFQCLAKFKNPLEIENHFLLEILSLNPARLAQPASRQPIPVAGHHLLSQSTRPMSRWRMLANTFSFQVCSFHLDALSLPSH
jgi:hypothetical protein